MLLEVHPLSPICFAFVILIAIVTGKFVNHTRSRKIRCTGNSTREGGGEGGGQLASEV